MRSLNDALRRVRIAEADRSDVASDLHEAERARLEILADELRSVFSEVPADDEQFILKVATGTQPRLWIDVTTFVIIGRDRRTYRFVKDTRLGRTIIVESASVEDVADTITNYIAERIIEREKTVEGDWLIKRVREDRSPSARRSTRRRELPEPDFDEPERRPARAERTALVPWVVAAGLGGVLLAVIVLLAIAWFRV
ncbi:MAG: hypothetical protein AB7O56_13490 [Bauldia sp.]